MHIFKPDAWSGWHCFGSAFGALALQHYGIPSPFLTMFALGVAWELGDQFGRRWFSWLDSRGYDLGDIICDGIGILLALSIRG